MCVYLFPLEDVSEVFQPETLQKLVDGHVEQSCRDTVKSAGVIRRIPAVTPVYINNIYARVLFISKEPARDLGYNLCVCTYFLLLFYQTQMLRLLVQWPLPL